MVLDALVVRQPNEDEEDAKDDDLTNLNWLQDHDLLTRVTGKLAKTRSRTKLDKDTLWSADVSGSSSISNSPLTPVAYDPQTHVHIKPPYSFSSLICMAIESSPHKALPVRQIYEWVQSNFPFYESTACGWKNTIRHNLSLSKSFRRVNLPASKFSQAKGSYWSVDPAFRNPPLKYSEKRSMNQSQPYLTTRRSYLHPPLYRNSVLLVSALQTITQIESFETKGFKTAENSPSEYPGLEHPLIDHSYSSKSVTNATTKETKIVNEAESFVAKMPMTNRGHFFQQNMWGK